MKNNKQNVYIAILIFIGVLAIIIFFQKNQSPVQFEGDTYQNKIKCCVGIIYPDSHDPCTGDPIYNSPDSPLSNEEEALPSNEKEAYAWFAKTDPNCNKKYMVKCDDLDFSKCIYPPPNEKGKNRLDLRSCTSLDTKLFRHSSSANVEQTILSSVIVCLNSNIPVTIIDTGCSTFQNCMQAKNYLNKLRSLLANYQDPVTHNPLTLTIVGPQCDNDYVGECESSVTITATVDSVSVTPGPCDGKCIANGQTKKCKDSNGIEKTQVCCGVGYDEYNNIILGAFADQCLGANQGQPSPSMNMISLP